MSEFWSSPVALMVAIGVASVVALYARQPSRSGTEDGRELGGRRPPLVRSWIPFMGSAIAYGKNVDTFLASCKSVRSLWHHSHSFSQRPAPAFVTGRRDRAQESRRELTPLTCFPLLLRETYGSIFTLHLAGQKITYAATPELIAAIYKNSKAFVFQPIRAELSTTLFGALTSFRFVPLHVCSLTLRILSF